MPLFDHSRPILFTNAQVVGTQGIRASSLRVERDRIAALDAAPRPNDVVMDLQGAFIFPGLVNAHEHLEHNHYGRVKFRETYRNSSEWVEDMRPRLQTDPNLLAGKSRPLADRLFIGGLKNLLAGATTVAHHNPFYRELRGPFPVRVLRHYGWAHSLYLQNGQAGANGESAGDVVQRYRATPSSRPFMVHLAEGVGESARAELAQLDRLGCLGPNTVLIHGVGIDAQGWRRVVQRGAGLVWCPASNLFLLGASIDLTGLAKRPRSEAERGEDLSRLTVALGTDSRLTGSRDLLDEMHVAAAARQFSPLEIFRMVTTSAACLLRLPYAGRITPGLPADLLILPPLAADPYHTLLAAERKAVRLAMVGGQPRYGAPELAEAFSARGVKPACARVDGALRLLAAPLTQRLRQCSIMEPGVELVS